MQDVQIDYLGKYGFNAREVVSTSQEKFVEAYKNSFPDLTQVQLKEVYKQCKDAVKEADKEQEEAQPPAPNNPE